MKKWILSHTHTHKQFAAYSKDLWRDIIRCTHGCCTVHLPIWVHLKTGTKVSQTDVTIFVDEDIVWFDVSVHEWESDVKLALSLVINYMCLYSKGPIIGSIDDHSTVTKYQSLHCLDN